jgi:hypothetical protein
LALREYLLRGGFLMLDDFWGTEEWNRFNESMKRVFPDRAAVEIADDDPIFHIVYDLDERYQIPGQWALRGGTTYRNDGATPRWRGIYDDHGRVIVAMTFNSDGRFVGMGGRPRLSRKILGAGNSRWRELCHLLDDALKTAPSRSPSVLPAAC